jgi:hypothetical protein
MGKHEIGYARVERDLYPTPAWITEALLVHVELAGTRAAPKENHAWFIWERSRLHEKRSPLILYAPAPDPSCTAARV